MCEVRLLLVPVQCHLAVLGFAIWIATLIMDIRVFGHLEGLCISHKAYESYSIELYKFDILLDRKSYELTFIHM